MELLAIYQRCEQENKGETGEIVEMYGTHRKEVKCVQDIGVESQGKGPIGKP